MADLEDRSRLATNQLFIGRVTAAVWVTANAVGVEATTASQQPRHVKRVELARQALQRPEEVGAWFARAAAGNTGIGNTFGDHAGPTDDDRVAAVLDATIQTYVAAAWDTVAGVWPWERGA